MSVSQPSVIRATWFLVGFQAVETGFDFLVTSHMVEVRNRNVVVAILTAFVVYLQLVILASEKNMRWWQTLFWPFIRFYYTPPPIKLLTVSFIISVILFIVSIYEENLGTWSTIRSIMVFFTNIWVFVLYKLVSEVDLQFPASDPSWWSSNLVAHQFSDSLKLGQKARVAFHDNLHTKTD